MIEYNIKPLDATTWPDFARLIEANNGVWGWVLVHVVSCEERKHRRLPGVKA